MIPGAIPSDEQVRALAVEVLKRPEYAVWRDTFWLVSALEWLRGLAEESPHLYWALLATLIGVTLVLLAHLVWALRKMLALTMPPPPRQTGGEEPSFVVEAEALAARGRFLEAARQLQLAVIQLLLRRRVLDLTRSDPNRTLRTRLRDAHMPEADRRDLLGLIDAFERGWFRDRREDPELYESWRAVHARLDTALGAP